MPGPIDRSLVKEKLRTDVERIQPTNLDLTAIRAVAHETMGEYADSVLFSDPTMVATLEGLLDYTNREGLGVEELKEALSEVRRHVSIQAHFDAQQAHEADRRAAGRNLFKHIALNIKDMQTVFGGGVASDVRKNEASAFSNGAELSNLLQSACELGVMRHRLKRYIELGGDNLKSAVDAFIHGHAHVNDLMNPSHEHGKHYEQGLDAIIGGLNLEVGRDFQLDGLGDIYIDTAETKAAIEHHLKFVLRTEIIKLAEANQLTVLSSEEYTVPNPTGGQKLLQAAKGVVLSGTFWGITTRLGTRAAIGGIVGIGAVSGGGALALGIGAGIAAGAAGAYVRESFNSADRLKRRRLEAALGGIGHGEVKPASEINAELKKATDELHAAPDQTKTIAAIKKAFAVASDAQARLRFARTGKGNKQQDFISFGAENRFRAQAELLSNIELTLAAVQRAMETLSDSDGSLTYVRGELKTINEHTVNDLKESRQKLNKKFTRDEEQRRKRAAIIGGVAGGLGSLVSHYALELWGGQKAAEEGMAATPESPAPAATLEVTAPTNELVNLPGAEPITTAGKMSFLETDPSHHYQMAMGSDHHFNVTKLNPDGTSVESVASADLSTVDGDTLQVVKADHLAKLFDANGHPVAEVHFNPTGTSSDITEQLFADAKTAKMLDAMGLQEGELQYDPTAKLFHIQDGALRDAAGKAEYLGQTDGWRARRMEFILKAMAEGKSDETPEMIVARAERATSNLLLTKGGLHDNPQAAFDEAFSKDPSFIQRNVMPWVDGTRSRVSSRWMHLVTEMKEHPITGTGTGSEVTITPITAGSEVGATLPDAQAIATEGVLAEGLQNGIEDFGVDMQTDHIAPLMAAILGSSAAEVVLYSMAPKADISHKAEHRNEFQGDDEHTVVETELMDVAETAKEIKEKKLEADKPERLALALAEIKKAVTEIMAAAKPAIDALQPVAADLASSSLEAKHIDALVANKANFALLDAHKQTAEQLLAKDGGDFTYEQLDKTNNGEALKHLVDQLKLTAELGDVVQKKFEATVAATANKITSVREDTGLTAAVRRQELGLLVDQLKIVDRARELVPDIISTIGWLPTLEAASAKAKTEAESAIAIIDIDTILSKSKDVKKEVMKRLEAEGCFDPTNPTLPSPTKAKYIVHLVKKMSTFKKGKTGLDEMGFVTEGTLGDEFEAEHKARIKQVLDRLFSGQDDIFAK